MVLASKEDVEEILSCVTIFLFEMDYIDFVIGRKGGKSRSRAMEDPLHVIEYFINNKDKKVMVMGTRCEKAARAIESLIESCKADYPYQEKLSVSTQLIGFFVEKMIRTKRGRIALKYAVHVYKSTSGTANHEVQPIFVNGSEAGNVSAAKQDILENLGTTILDDLDERFVRGVILH